MKNLCDFRPAVTKVAAHGHDHPRKLASTSFSADAKSVCALRLSFCSRDDDSLQEKPDEAKVSSSSEYQNWLMGLDKIRKIVSDSLYGEL